MARMQRVSSPPAMPPMKNAFDVLMAMPKSPEVAVTSDDDEEKSEPVRTAVLYKAHLEHADASEPLWRVPYFGQVVRVGTAETIFADRKREHELKAARDDKDLGLHAVIKRFGIKALEWHIVSSATGSRIEMRKLANAEEIRLIDEHGGVLRDMDERLEQTLNIIKAPTGDAREAWESLDARRQRALNKFKAAMQKYVKMYGSALVPYDYVNDDKYRLGTQLNSFRQGAMLKGMRNEKEIRAWAEALPKFAWKASKTEESRKQKCQRAAKQFATTRRAELERARLMVVPFVKSKKRRAKMRAASSDFSGKWGNSVLYMVSKDGKTIRRVSTCGQMGKSDIVGPVVDSPPPDAFDLNLD